MKISLKCEDGIRKIIEELLVHNDFQIEEGCNIAFVEKNCLKEENSPVYLVFDKNDLSSFLDFIKEVRKQEKTKERFITLKGEENFELFPHNKTQYFEADNNDVFCIIENDKKLYRVKDKLYELEDKLDSKIFMRVSKSNIVNILNVKEIIPWFSSKLLLKFKGSNKKVEVTRTYIKEFKKNIGI